MSDFIQLHLLTAYPPANLNRDDLGRPKTARVGGVERLRVSSQSLKRTWRTSNLFESALNGHIGIRTKRFGTKILEHLIKEGMNEKMAIKCAEKIAAVFGKLKDKSNDIEQIAHISPEEHDATLSLATILAKEHREPTDEDLKLLRFEHTAVDIALFGRMLASHPAYDVEAACQVAHAISVHAVVVEDDFFTAVDDLNQGHEHKGSAHLSEAGFAAALFYSYICINKTLLIENLGNNVELAHKAIAALVEAAVKVSPRGKQNSFGSHAYANYVLAEKGTQQPRSLSVAFLRAINHEDQASAAIRALETQRQHFDEVYGACADDYYSFNAFVGKGTLTELIRFVTA